MNFGANFINAQIEIKNLHYLHSYFFTVQVINFYWSKIRPREKMLSSTLDRLFLKVKTQEDSPNKNTNRSLISIFSLLAWELSHSLPYLFFIFCKNFFLLYIMFLLYLSLSQIEFSLQFSPTFIFHLIYIILSASPV